jgi:chloride channel protein, CIC family
MEGGRHQPSKRARALIFSFLTLLTGIVAGLGAIFFRGLIAVFHNLLFLGKLSFSYNATIHTPAGPLGPFVILVPVVGALGVAYLVKNYAPEAKGHGVPEVMEAIHYNRGRMRPIVAVIKSLASALSIGSGGSIGREGPIVQIGSAFSAMIGEYLHLPTWQRITLIAAGAGGGIAATFNTPVGGVLFALELMLQEVSVRTLVPVTIATVTATYIGQIAFGPHPAFVVPAFETPFFHLTNPLVLLAYAGLGIVTGLVSALFIVTLYGFESIFENRIGGSYYRQHSIGMFLVGLMFYALMMATGHYYVEGVGYATVQDVLSGKQLGLVLLLALFALKLLATSLTLGSGASGGVFSPSLFMGATLGGAYGTVVRFLGPGLNIGPAAFAVVGMAGVVGASTAAPITAIVMIFEMTLDYRVVVPMTLTVAVSYGVRRAIEKESIYTRKLVLRGHPVPEALQNSIYLARAARSLMDTRIETVPAAETVESFLSRPAQEGTAWFLLVEDGRVVGLLPNTVGVASKTGAGTKLGELARRDFCFVREDALLASVCRSMSRQNASFALVTSDGQISTEHVKGLITSGRIANIIGEASEAFEED